MQSPCWWPLLVTGRCGFGGQFSFSPTAPCPLSSCPPTSCHVCLHICWDNPVHFLSPLAVPSQPSLSTGAIITLTLQTTVSHTSKCSLVELENLALGVPSVWLSRKHSLSPTHFRKEVYTLHVLRTMLGCISDLLIVTLQSSFNDLCFIKKMKARRD